MLTTLKDIFRPTRKKLAWTLALGIPPTVVGFLWLQKPSVSHSPLMLLGVFLIFLLPALYTELFGGISSFSAASPVTLLILGVLQFLYFYVPVCMVLSLKRKKPPTQRGN